MESLQEELKASDWANQRLLIDIKCDGLRLSIGKVGGKPFCYVDPDTLKEKSPDVSERLPLIVKELNTIPDNTILDGEFIAVKGDEILHRTTANSLLNATNFAPEKLAQYAYIFIFDVLVFKGQDIRNQPLHERLEYLQQINPTEHIWIERASTNLDAEADGYIVNGSSIKDINLAINKILNDQIGRPKFIAEGCMVKDINHQYEYPQNKGWGKLKKFYEVDCMVWDKKLVKGQDDVWNYFLGINIDKEHYNNLPTKIKVPNQLQMFYGKSNSTSVKCDTNDVLRVASEEVIKYENDGYPYYRGYISRALEPIPEKNVSDKLEVLDKLSQYQPKRMPIKDIERIEGAESPLKQEEITSPPSGGTRPSEEEPGEEVIKRHIGLSYKYPISIADLIRLAEISREEILEWVNKKRIPKKIYNELAEEGKPLPRQIYTNQLHGKAWAQMHFRGIEPEKYEAIKSGKLQLYKALIGQSVHIDLRVDYPGLPKLVQFVITENDVQSMLKMMKGERRQTAGGINVQHSMVVSKPSGEPPEGPEKFYEKVDPESTKPEEYMPSINEEGAKIAQALDLGESSYWISPGGIGATKNTYSYMMHIWSGDIVTGCERHDLHELFMIKKEGNDDILNGRYVIKCLKREDTSARWEMWKSIRDSRPMDPIQHSDIGYHYLVPADIKKGYGREAYRKASQEKYISKLS